MKKLIGLLSILLIGYTASAQYRIQKVSENVNTTQEGIYYSLPQTVIKLNVTVERIDQVPGPLSDHSKDFLGNTEFIKESKSYYNIIDIDISAFAEADPDQSFYLSFPEYKEKDAPKNSFQLSRIGCLLSYNGNEGMINKLNESTELKQTNYYFKDDEAFRYFADYNRKKVIDTIVRKITIDTVTIDRFLFKTNWVNLSEKDKANQAALKIQSIREQRFNLLTGYQEVNYSGSIEYMDFQLKKMENDYLQLFLGKEIRSIETYSVYIIPKSGQVNQDILSFEDGSILSIEIDVHGNTALMPDQPLLKENHIYYRVPENATLNVKFGGKVQKSANMIINQLGKLSMAPLNNTQLYFDANTGNLIQIVKK